MTHLYEYSDNDFIFETNWNNEEQSAFEKTLMDRWSSLHEEESVFKFKLHIEAEQVLQGKYGYFAQLNTARALLRRKPAMMQSMNQPFDPSTFNFTKMDNREILFQVSSKQASKGDDYVVVNVSPLEFGHSLLLPSLHSCLPQVVTADSLLTALQVFLLSKSPSMRMGFNGLCAYASLNHLHYHIYYLNQRMLLETVDVEHLAGPCYVLKSFPSRGFVFQLTQWQDIQQFVSDVFKLVSWLQKNQKPHNIFLTRGSGLRETTVGSERNCVRLYVWTRKPVFGDKEMTKFNPALCEMFGHLLIKNKEDYDSLTEDFVAGIMSDLTTEPFNSVVSDVKQLFQDS